ncbi:hypothetical protein AMTRI_Chr13g125060 [Amborella trichopoda]
MVSNSISSQILILYILILLFPYICAQISRSPCHRFCGGKKLPFPFGFSSNCPIPLNCSIKGDITLHDFKILNITVDGILLEYPAICNRKVSDLNRLFGPNFAISSRNGLLLQDCKKSVSDCLISSSLLHDRFNISQCRVSGNISCFSANDHGYLKWKEINGSGCGSLLSSFALDQSRSPKISLDFEVLELSWWMTGNCDNTSCSEESNCSEFEIPVTGRHGFRCSCRHGFHGDGFKRGDGCHKDSSKCNPSNYIKGRCGGTTRVVVLIGGLLAGASIMAGLAVLFYCLRRQPTCFRTRKSNKHLISAAAHSFTVPLYPYREVERATKGFSEKQRLGTGAYGTVYAGKLHNDEWVAVKKIRHKDTEGIEQVMNEIKLLSSVSHPNLVRLLGCCIERDEQILVYEYMPNGTVAQHLQRERGQGLSWNVRLAIASETAHAIAHLHSAINPPIYHRDIKSSNILLDYNFNSKVADFGLSRLVLSESSHISTAPQGTPGYLDPQYHQNFHLSDKSDVYSFGVVLVEIITALKVVDFNRSQSEVNLAALAIDKIGKGLVDEIIDPFLEPHSDAWTLSSVHKVAELAFRCLAFHRDVRPSMMEVSTELDQIRMSGWAHMEVGGVSFAGVCTSPSVRASKRDDGGGCGGGGGGGGGVVVSSSLEDLKGGSPVSVQDPWFSEQSSPSTNSLLGNVVQ